MKRNTSNKTYEYPCFLRFIGRNREILKDVAFPSRSSAEQAVAEVLKSPESDEYKRIALMYEDINLTVERIWLRDGLSWIDYSDGEAVLLKPESCEGERHFIYAVTNIHEDSGCCSIVCINSGMVFHLSSSATLDDLMKLPY